MVSISISALSEYIARKPESRNGVIRTAKKQIRDRQVQEDGKRKPAFGSIHYASACKDIRDYHENKRPVSWLVDKAIDLKNQIHKDMPDQKQTRLNSCSRALEEYSRFPLEGNITLLPLNRMVYFPSGIDLAINIKPDMHILRENREEFVKFNFSEEKVLNVQKERYWDIYTQIMYMAMFDDESIGNDFGAIVLHSHHRIFNSVSRLDQVAVLEIEDLCRELVENWPHVSV